MLSGSAISSSYGKLFVSKECNTAFVVKRPVYIN
jgi:hypothetical protein